MPFQTLVGTIAAIIGFLMISYSFVDKGGREEDRYEGIKFTVAFIGTFLLIIGLSFMLSGSAVK